MNDAGRGRGRRWGVRAAAFCLIVLALGFEGLDARDAGGAAAADSLPSPLGAAVRSLVLPGWGQFYNGRRLKSAGVFLVEGTVIALAVRESRRYEKYGYGDAHEKRNTLLWWTFFLHAAAVMEAYVDASLMNFSENMDISLERGSRTWAMTLSYRW